jgi:hypothetical protein
VAIFQYRFWNEVKTRILPDHDLESQINNGLATNK